MDTFIIFLIFIGILFYILGAYYVGAFEIFILENINSTTAKRVLINFFKNLIITPIPSAIKLIKHGNKLNPQLSLSMDQNIIPYKIKDKLITINVKYYGFDNEIHSGQLVVHSDLQFEILNIFNELLKINFPIEKIKPISLYNWSDLESVKDNNTSCFNYRFINGTKKLSDHAKGSAIDINPFQNPWIHPSAFKIEGRKYDPSQKGTINDKVVEIFEIYGWKWGGNWKNPDYQHFYKPNFKISKLYYLLDMFKIKRGS